MAEYIVDTEKAPSVLRDLIKHESVNLQKVVRCRDCKYNDFGECEHPRFYAKFTYWDNSKEEFRPSADDPDGYCAWGEISDVRRSR